jgi:hypothetical protein
MHPPLNALRRVTAMAERTRKRQAVETGDGTAGAAATTAGSATAASGNAGNGVEPAQRAADAPGSQSGDGAAAPIGTTSTAAARKHPPWAFIAGAVFGGLTLIFFMGLVLLAAFDRPIPCESRFLVTVVLALGGALASSFIGGSAAAKGEIPIGIATRNPVGFSVVGGIAVLLLLMLVGHFGYASDCGRGSNAGTVEERAAETPTAPSPGQ